MSVVAVAHQKGGVGKTTLAVNLARACYERGQRALLIDADPQKSLRGFAEERILHDGLQALPITEKSYPTLHKEIVELAKGFDHVFIDCGGRLSDVFTSALKAADIVLMPMKPGPQELRSAQGTFDLLSEIAIDYPGKTVLVVYNLVRQTRYFKEMRSIDEQIAERYNVNFLDTYISLREAWLNSFAAGMCVTEAQGRDRDAKAIADLFNLWTELQNIHDQLTAGRER